MISLDCSGRVSPPYEDSFFYTVLSLGRIFQWQLLSKLPGLYCNRTWDGWLCWDDTPAGVTAYQNCPDYFPDFDVTGKVLVSLMIFVIQMPLNYESYIQYFTLTSPFTL